MASLLKESPLSPLFQRGVYSSLWQREARRDFIAIHVFILMIALVIHD
jgi:hypothetical protein